MRKKTLFMSILFIFLLTLSVSAVVVEEYTGQEKKEIRLATKYKAFIAETERFMHSKEKEVFLQLENDRERDLFIKKFWNSRGGRQRRVRANINMLRLVRMIQVLDLTEDQVAMILPEMNKNEEEKQKLQRDIQLQLKDLRVLLLREALDEQKLEEHLNRIKALKRTLQDKEAELERFLFEKLSLAQQASYIIFSQEFYRGLQDQLNNARRTQQKLQQRRRKKR